MRKFFIKLGVVVFILLLELSTTALLFLVPLRLTVSKKSMKEFVMNYMENMGEDDIFMEAATASLKPLYKESQALGIEEEAIQKIIKTEEVRELVADITSDMVAYIFTGEEKETFTEEDLQRVASIAIDKINQETPYQITEGQKQEILDALQRNTESYLESMPKVQTLEESLSSEEKDALHLVRVLFSTKLVISLIFVMITSMGGIILLKWKEKKWIKTGATTLLISSMITLLGTLLFQGINQLVFREEALYVFYLFQKMIQQSFLLAGSVAISMIIILILYKVFCLSKKERTAVN